jgi:hypothetical protein
MRHHVAAAGLLVAVLLVWFHPLLGGDQLTQGHALYLNVPWASEAPPGIADAARSGEGDAAVALEPIAEMARTSVRDGACRCSTRRSTPVPRWWATCSRRSPCRGSG